MALLGKCGNSRANTCKKKSKKKSTDATQVVSHLGEKSRNLWRCCTWSKLGSYTASSVIAAPVIYLTLSRGPDVDNCPLMGSVVVRWLLLLPQIIKILVQCLNLHLQIKEIYHCEPEDHNEPLANETCVCVQVMLPRVRVNGAYMCE